MGKIRWYKRDPDAALQGMFELTLEERGAYNTVLDLIYSRANELPDDDRVIAGQLRVDLRVWRRIKERLIALGKLSVIDGRLRNRRADVVIDEALHRALSAREAGRASAISRRHSSEAISTEDRAAVNDLAATDAPTTVATDAPTTVPTNQNLEERKKERGGAGAPTTTGRYAWSGRVVRLNRTDYDRWRKAYHAIHDFDAALQAADDYYAENPPKDGKWFFAVSRWLKQDHDRALKEAAADDEPILGMGLVR